MSIAVNFINGRGELIEGEVTYKRWVSPTYAWAEKFRKSLAMPIEKFLKKDLIKMKTQLNLKSIPAKLVAPKNLTYGQFFTRYFPGCKLSETKKGDIYITSKMAKSYYEDYLKSGLSFKEYDEGDI